VLLGRVERRGWVSTEEEWEPVRPRSGPRWVNSLPCPPLWWQCRTENTEKRQRWMPTLQIKRTSLRPTWKVDLNPLITHFTTAGWVVRADERTTFGLVEVNSRDWTELKLTEVRTEACWHGSTRLWCAQTGFSRSLRCVKQNNLSRNKPCSKQAVATLCWWAT